MFCFRIFLFLYFIALQFLYISILIEYVAIEPGGSVYVCLSVCLCTSMCVWSLQPKRTKRFWRLFYKWSDRYLPVTFFVVFQSSNLMTSWWPFCIFAFRHSHGRNFGPTFFNLNLDLIARWSGVFQCLLLKISKIVDSFRW